MLKTDKVTLLKAWYNLKGTYAGFFFEKYEDAKLYKEIYEAQKKEAEEGKIDWDEVGLMPDEIDSKVLSYDEDRNYGKIEEDDEVSISINNNGRVSSYDVVIDKILEMRLGY